MQDTIDSIMAGGVINPILVRPAEDGKFEVVSGHRRFRASELAGKADIKAIVREMDTNTFRERMVASSLSKSSGRLTLANSSMRKWTGTGSAPLYLSSARRNSCSKVQLYTMLTRKLKLTSWSGIRANRATFFSPREASSSSSVAVSAATLARLNFSNRAASVI